ncbi:MAG: CPBP family intramembrane glutamic endopeptidase [Bacteroidota bacterium]
MNEIEPTFFDHLLIFLLGIVLPLFAVFQSQPEMKAVTFNTQMKKQVYYGNGIFQWICAFVILVVWWAYDRPLPDLGFQWGAWSTVSVALLGLFIFLYLMDVWSELRNAEKIAATKDKWLKEIPILPATFEEFKHFLFVALTAGVCEEIIFRGFFVNYFLAINENNALGNWLAVLIPAFLFAFGHMYQGSKAVVKVMLMAVLFGWIYLLTRSLLLLMLIHFLVDVLGGYLAYRILKDEAMKEEMVD